MLFASGGCRESAPAAEPPDEAAAAPPVAPKRGRRAAPPPEAEPPFVRESAPARRESIDRIVCSSDGTTTVTAHRGGAVSVWRDGVAVFSAEVPDAVFLTSLVITSDGAFALGVTETSESLESWGIRLRDLRGFGALARPGVAPDADGEREYVDAREAAEPVRLIRPREIRFGPGSADSGRVTMSAIPLRKILAPAQDGAVIAEAADGRAVMIARDGAVRWTMQGYAATGVSLDAAGGDRVGWHPRGASVDAAHGVCVIELGGDGKSHRNYGEDEVVGVSLASGEVLWRVELPEASDIALGGKDGLWGAVELGRRGLWLTLFSPEDGRRLHAMRVSGFGGRWVRLARDAHVAWMDDGGTTPRRMTWDPASFAAATGD